MINENEYSRHKIIIFDRDAKTFYEENYSTSGAENDEYHYFKPDTVESQFYILK